MTQMIGQYLNKLDLIDQSLIFAIKTGSATRRDGYKKFNNKDNKQTSKRLQNKQQ